MSRLMVELRDVAAWHELNRFGVTVIVVVVFGVVVVAATPLLDKWRRPTLRLHTTTTTTRKAARARLDAAHESRCVVSGGSRWTSSRGWRRTAPKCARVIEPFL